MAIEKRASVREFAPGEMPREHLLGILDAGRRAPSGNNYQGHEFIAVQDRGTLTQLARIQECLGQAAAAIVIVGPVSKYTREDVAAAVENMLLAATALGYGALWVESYLHPRQDMARFLLEVPDCLNIIAILAVGHPVNPPRQADKKPLAQMIHWDRYGHKTGRAPAPSVE